MLPTGECPIGPKRILPILRQSEVKPIELVLSLCQQKQNRGPVLGVDPSAGTRTQVDVNVIARAIPNTTIRVLVPAESNPYEIHPYVRSAALPTWSFPGLWVDLLPG